MRAMLRCILHWLLVIALALAGVGNAAASVAMGAMHARGPAATVPADVPSADPHAHAAPHAAADAHMEVGIPDPGAKGTHDCDGNCCTDAGGCACPCLHLVQDVAFVPLVLGAARLAQAPGGSVPVQGLPAPVLREDIRPPIDPA